MTDTINTPQAELSGDVLFYVQPEPLSKEAHEGLGIRSLEHPYAFTAKSHLVPLTVTEFGPAALCYPVIFVGQDKMPVAVMGVNSNETCSSTTRASSSRTAICPPMCAAIPSSWLTTPRPSA